MNDYNSPSVDVAQRDPATLETIISSGFAGFSIVEMASRPGNALAAAADEIVSVQDYVRATSAEPRQEFDNRDVQQTTTRSPWYDLLSVIASETDALRALDAGTVLGQVTVARPKGNTDRGRIFALMSRGLCTIQQGLLFDKAFIVNETSKPDPGGDDFHPGAEVVAAGISDLRKAIALAETSLPDTLPINWIVGGQRTYPELIRIMHSYIARSMVYAARTPTERAAVDWPTVIAEINKGITANFTTLLEGTYGWGGSGYWTSSQSAGTSSSSGQRTSNKLLGPADTSGKYQAWLAAPLGTRVPFTISTPDRRIHRAAGATAAGTYYAFQTASMYTGFGTYFLSNYRNVRIGTAYFVNDIGSTITHVSLAEMDFLRAEALYRTGDKAGAAAILNKTRVANGQLAPVTVDGPPNTASCVPRRNDGTCGDLMDALQYEKRIEMYPTNPIVAWADARGWGKLLKGSLMNLPVSGRDLASLGLPIYSFGGSLPGSAP
ncbi:MAG: hypothetical protein ABJB74_16445 [Gemmatimonas sp.]